jgi:hypothetical protein
MSVESVLNNFGKRVVKEARTSLTKQKINVSKELYNSINYDLKVSKNSFEFTLNMVDYGKFIDKGVQGKKSNKKAPNSPFKYRDKRPPVKVFDKWSIKKGIAPRNAKGQFISRTQNNFRIANAVYNYGIKTTNFFTKPFESAFKSLPDEIINGYALTIDKLLANV